MLILGILVLTSLLCTGPVTSSSDLTKQKLSGIMLWEFEKRPFCNAFTGCGRKREIKSGPELNMDHHFAEILSNFLDINSEPSVENVYKQIMSRAKIFEAIKEAKKEIMFQKSKNEISNV